MQPPLVLAFLLAVSGVGGPERDIHSVSAYISTIEQGARGVVVECTFPPGEDAAVARRPSEKSLLAVPEGEVSVRLLEAEYRDFVGDASPTPVLAWVSGVPGAATDVPADGRDLVRIRTLGVCRDLRLAELEVVQRQELPPQPSKGYRLYRRLRFEIGFPAAAEEWPGGEPGDRSTDRFEALFAGILLNAPVPAALRIPPASPGVAVYRELPAGLRGDVRKVLAEGEGFFALPFGSLSDAGVRDPQSGAALYDGWMLKKCFRIRNRPWPDGALGFYSRDASPFSRWNALWLVPSATETLPLLEPSGSVEGECIREATLTDRYEQDLVFKPEGEANEHQERDWLWAAVDGAAEEGHPPGGPFDFRIPISDLAPAADSLEVAVHCVTPKDKFNRRVRVTDYGFQVAGMEVPSASLGRSGKGSGGEDYVITVPIHLTPEQRAEFEAGGGIPVSIVAQSPLRQTSAEPANPLYVDAIEATYRHRLMLRNGEIRIPIGDASGPWEIALPPDRQGEVGGLIAAVVGPGGLELLPASEPTEEGNAIRVAALPEGATGAGWELRVFAEERVREAGSPVVPAGSRLLSSDLGADSVFITHASLRAGLEPLVEWHRSRGARVEVVLTDEIYDVFGDGTLSPHAIREFLRYAFHHWRRPALSVVILVGDATWDYKERFANGIRNYVPGYRVTGAYPNDHWFVTFEGDDKLPEMMIGRIPVFDATTLATVTEKIVGGYEPPGPWRVRALMLSDKEPEFVREIDDLLTGPYVAPYLRYQWLRLSDFPFSDNYYHPESLMMAEQTKHSPECNQAIIDWLDRGALLWDFHGHGAPNVLGHERIFFGGGSIYTDVKKLSNGRRYPLFVANTCDTARFDYAQEKWNISLGEDLLHFADGGCIAMFLHTGRGYPGQHRVIDRLFLDSMFRLRLPLAGQIFTAGKILYLLNPKPPEPLDMMVLIGDPMIPFPLPQEQLRVTVATPRLTPPRAGRLEIEFEASPVSAALAELAGAAEYRAYAYVTASDQEVVWEEENLPLGSSDLRQRVAVPGDIVPGEGKVGVYFYPVGEGPARSLPDAVGYATFEVAVDPAIEEELRARVRPGGTPNLRISRLVLEPTEPVNGHTIWIRADVVNDGTAAASPVDAIAYVGEGTDTPRIQGWAPRREDIWSLERLYPGEEKPVVLRWDPFANAGRQVVRVVLDPKNRIPESNEEDNSATAEILVKKKADLVIDERLVALVVRSATPTLVFRFVNLGESPAEQDFRADVKFLAAEDSDPIATDAIAFLREEGNVPVRPGAYLQYRGPVPEGARWVDILIDPDDIVDEETHENNRTRVELEAVRKPPRE